jgi:glycosyltransferase involved in cell wall biosynthesis
MEWLENKVTKLELDNPKALFVAPLRDFSGYASVSRDYVRALNDAGGLHLVTRDLRYDGGEYKRNPLEELLSKRDAQNINIIIQQTTPNEMEPKDGCFNVGIFCWETDRIPDLWIQQLNKMDLILVPCEDNLLTVRKCGVLTPVEKIHYSCTTEEYDEELTPFVIPGASHAFKMLAICQYSKKKGIDPLLKAYLSEFREQDNTVLLLKTYFGPNDGQAETQKMAEILNVMKNALRLKKYPKVQLIHEVLDFHDIKRLYATADLYCLPSRGEGWGVPHFNALGYGLPAIATRGTGPEEFITPECGWLVNSHLSPCIDMPHPHEFMYTAKDNWHEPQVCDLKRCMREAYELWSRRNEPGGEVWDNMCVAAQARVKDFSNDTIGPKLRDTILRYYKMWRAACSST